MGHSVVCVDIDENKILALKSGTVPFFEPHLSELVVQEQARGRLSYTSDASEGLCKAEAVFIAVGTPPDEFGGVNMSAFWSAVDGVAQFIEYDSVLIIKSTVPIGTNSAVREKLPNSISVASNPEFLREGRAIKDFFHPDRIVAGVSDERSKSVIENLYSQTQAQLFFMSPESAELVKYASNAFLATKISYINEIANLAERVGADIRDVALAVGEDKRIGKDFLNAGIGYGGSCFPKDISALHYMAGENGCDFTLLASVIDVNNKQRERFVQKIISDLGVLEGRNIAVWGLAFKNGTDDIRESAAIDIVVKCLEHGANVCVFDPKAMENAYRSVGSSVAFAKTALDAVVRADALVVATEWPEFALQDFDEVKNRMRGNKIYDGRNILSNLKLNDKGFEYYGVGIK